MSRFKFSANNVESIDIERIRVKVDTEADSQAFSSASGTLRAYEGGTMSGNTLTGGTLVGTGAFVLVLSSAAEADLTISPTLRVPVDSSKYLTIVVDLNSISGGSSSGLTPYISLDSSQNTGNWDTNYSSTARYNVKATGVSSGSAIYVATSGGTKDGQAAYIAKTKLGMAVNSASPTGTATRQADHTIFKLAMTNTSVDQDALFRAGASQYTAGVIDGSNGTWTAMTAGDTVAADTTNYITGSGAVKVTLDTPAATNDGMYWNAAADTDLSDYERVSVWIRSSIAVGTAGDLDFEVDDAADFATPLLSSDIPTLNANTWYRHDAALGGAISATAQYWGVLVEANATTYNSAVITLDNIVFYKDALKVKLSSNAGLFNTTGATNTAVNLKDGSSTLATGYVSGTSSVGLSTSNAEVMFIPTTEMAIPASGKTYNVVADTTALITATSKDLTMSINLGSASSIGGITAGNVLWNDNSATTAIGWVDSPDSPLARGLNF